MDAISEASKKNEPPYPNSRSTPGKQIIRYEHNSKYFQTPTPNKINCNALNSVILKLLSPNLQSSYIQQNSPFVKETNNNTDVSQYLN